MASEDYREQAGHTGAATPLSREDIERLLSQGGGSTALHLRARNLQNSDLSYLDLQGADLQNANLRGANLRGTNLSRADLQGADLSDADLDGADLSRAWLGQATAECVRLTRTKLSYALLRELDLRDFDLTGLNLYHADLSGSDLRGAILRGADLRGADLSTALLHGPELQGAILYRGAFLRDREKQTGWEETNRLRAAVKPKQVPTRDELAGAGLAWAPAMEESASRQPLAEREAYLLGAYTLLHGLDTFQIRQLFPRGFSFARSRQLFENWLQQTGTAYNEQEVQALWIGFARSICDKYFEGDLNA